MQEGDTQLGGYGPEDELKESIAYGLLTDALAEAERADALRKSVAYELLTTTLAEERRAEALRESGAYALLTATLAEAERADTLRESVAYELLTTTLTEVAPGVNSSARGRDSAPTVNMLGPDGKNLVMEKLLEQARVEGAQVRKVMFGGGEPTLGAVAAGEVRSVNRPAKTPADSVNIRFIKGGKDFVPANADRARLNLFTADGLGAGKVFRNPPLIAEAQGLIVPENADLETAFDHLSTSEKTLILTTVDEAGSVAEFDKTLGPDGPNCSLLLEAALGKLFAPRTWVVLGGEYWTVLHSICDADSNLLAVELQSVADEKRTASPTFGQILKENGFALV